MHAQTPTLQLSKADASSAVMLCANAAGRPRSAAGSAFLQPEVPRSRDAAWCSMVRCGRSTRGSLGLLLHGSSSRRGETATSEAGRSREAVPLNQGEPDWWGRGRSAWRGQAGQEARSKQGCCQEGNPWPQLRVTFAVGLEVLLPVAAEIPPLLHDALLCSASVGLWCVHVLSLLSFCSLVLPPCIFSMRDSTSAE